MQEKITEIIKDALVELNETLGLEALKHPTEETLLYGPKGVLSSLELVNLIVLVEERIEQVFGIEIILADDRALSQRLSPFVQVKRLARYIEKLLKENRDE